MSAPTAEDVRAAVLASVREGVPREAHVATVLASTWATGEVTRSPEGAVWSDVDVHVVVRAARPGMGEAVERAFARRVPGVGLDCHVLPQARLGRLQRTLEAATTREVGVVLEGDPRVLEGFPRMADVPRAEPVRLLLNRTVELLEARTQPAGGGKFAPAYAAVKALADVAPFLLYERGVPPTYRGRLDALADLSPADPLAAEAVRGLRMKLGLAAWPPEDKGYAAAREALLAALARAGVHPETAGADLHRLRVFGSTLRGWGAVAKNPALRRPAGLPRTPAAALRNPRALLYGCFVAALAHAPAPDALAARVPPHLPRASPWRLRLAPDATLADFVRACTSYLRADVRKQELIL